MHVLVKLVCDRCFAMCRADLESEGWTAERTESNPGEGICSVCGRAEGRRTVQLDTAELGIRLRGPAEGDGDGHA